MIVASALGGITDLLLDAATNAAAGRLDAAEQSADAFRARHRNAATAVLKPSPARRQLLAEIDRSSVEFHELYTPTEQQQFGVEQGTEVRVPVLSLAF